MAVINDRSEKAQSASTSEPVIIIAEDHADKLICRICGKQYPSRGKWDPGICRTCEKIEAEKNTTLIGGPLDGEKAHDKS